MNAFASGSARRSRRGAVVVGAAQRAAIEILEGRQLLSAAVGVDAANNLLRFDTATPGTVTTVPITGLVGGDSVVGIDRRPVNGLVYALGSGGRLYTLDPSTGVATFGFSLISDPGDATNPFTTLNGTNFGVDFNPAADRLRVVSDTNQNLRINVATGQVTTDDDLNPGGASVGGVAYTNNDNDPATATALYDIDITTDTLVIQNPPNNGTLATVGALGVDATGVAGFDIQTVGTANNAFGALTVGGVTGLYSINLTSGAATFGGAIGAGSTALRGLTVIVDGTDLVVTNTNNAGAGSLRNAINASNALPGANTITFNIPGGGVKTIVLTSSLPGLSDAVTIDGYSQPGASPNTLGVGAGSNAVIKIEIDANTHDGVDVDAGGGGSIIRGLSLGGDAGSGLNVSAPDVVIAGNFIGLRADGVTPFANATNGVHVTPGGEGLRVGGTAPADRNVIAANGEDGIRLEVDAVIQGNLIGLDATGTLDRGNGGNGVDAVGTALEDSLIGGDTLAARNVISGNGRAGIGVSNMADPGDAFPILNNYLGTDVTGTLDRGNDGSGVGISFIRAVRIGAPGAGNLIRFNGGSGIGFGIFGNDATIQGNAILDNGLDGISTNQGDNLLVGGTAPGAGNVIGRNGGRGIDLDGANTFGARILGNFIGTDATGADLGNAGDGVRTARFTFSEIGGPVPAAGNTIAFNGGAGVAMEGGDAASAEIRLNSIYANDGLGIDLGEDGVTPNDSGDTDGSSGGGEPNGLQNFPVLGSATVFGGLTTVQGSLNSESNKVYLIDFYANAGFDPSAYGEGERYLGSVTVSTNGSGNGTYSASFPVLPAGQYVTATATTANFTPGSTSEFSQPVQVIAPPTPPNPTIAVAADVSQAEGTGANTTLTFTVTRSGNTTAASTVNYSTGDGTATSGSDYFAQSGTLNFAPGETSKTVSVTVVADAIVELDEQFVLNLSGATGGTIGDNQAVGTITNDDFPPPVLTINDLSIVEGSGGGTTAFQFIVTRTGSLLAPSTVQFSTANGSAIAPGDFAAQSGTVTFPVGSDTQAVTIQVARDNISEADETFFVNLFNPSGATIGDAQGQGTIQNDDIFTGSAVLGPDPGQPGKTALLVTGTPGNDVIDFDAGSSSSKVKVTINGVSFGEFSTSSISRLYVFAGDGNDHVSVTTKYTKDAVLVGGLGQDDMKGGYGKDILIGGDDNDVLSGRKGRDVLIGGAGADGISGDEDDDLLIAASTTFDADYASLLAIQKEWVSSNSYSKRVDNLKNGKGSTGGVKLNDASILDDQQIDVLAGGASTDAFFAQKDSGVGIVKDTLSDKSSSETLVDVN